jgi:hypothetical protein
MLTELRRRKSLEEPSIVWAADDVAITAISPMVWKAEVLNMGRSSGDVDDSCVRDSRAITHLQDRQLA